MESLRPQPDHDIEIQRFFTFLNDERGESSEENSLPCARFVPKSSLQQYFSRDSGSLERLLHAVIEKEEDRPDVDTVEEEYLSILAILVCIGCGAFLNRFVQQNHSDKHLPFNEQPKFFPTSSNRSLYDLFAEKQWPFCPQSFDKRMDDRDMGRECVLPVISKQLLKASAPATIYKVKIHEEYDHLRGDPVMVQGVPNDSKHRKHTYIFKEFTGAYGRDAYDKERTAFKYLKKTQQLGKTIIGYYGSFTRNGTHTLILEYADRGTLLDFLRTIEAPSTGTDAVKLWKSLLTIQDALYTIHEIPTNDLKYNNEVTEFSALRGWHSDLKLANILVVSGDTDSPFDCEFRLADLGTSNFAKSAALGHDFKTAGERATREYGAPEFYQDGFPGHNPLLNPQKADIWSLGCIYSEFAVWIVYGQTGFRQYKEDRKQKTKLRGIKDIGCFHDGERALNCVKKWNDRISDAKLKSDHVTKSVLQKLVNEMLYAEADTRPSAKQLKMKTKDIFETTRPILANSGRRGLTTSDSTDQLLQQLHLEKQHRQPRKSEDADSGDESDAPALTVPFPLRQSTHLTGGAVQPLTSHDTTLLGRRVFESPYQVDLDEGTRNSSPRSAFSGGKKQPSLTSMHRGLSQRDDVRQVPDSPGVRTSHARFSSRKERSEEDLPNCSIDLHSLAMPDSRKEIDRPSLEADEHHAASDMMKSTRLIDAPFQLPALVLPSSEAPKPTAVKPSLTLDQGLMYYSESKTTKAGRSLPLNDGGCLMTLKDPERDFVFLIDDSASMRPYRGEVLKAVKLLAWLLKEYDKDGIDMYFMKEAGQKHARAGHSSDLLPHVKAIMGACRGTSDVTHRLGTILHEYRQSLDQSQQPKWRPLKSFLHSTKIKPLSIYVLTDGEWEPRSDPSKSICDTAKFLEQQGLPASQLGIQFIRFGDRPENKAKLDHLDSRLGAVRDMVDTEPISGNVFKMILGPISKMWDDDEILLPRS